MTSTAKQYGAAFCEAVCEVLDRGWLSAKQIAAAAGTTDGHVSLWRHGRSIPSVGVLLAMYDRLGELPGVDGDAVRLARMRLAALLPEVLRLGHEDRIEAESRTPAERLESLMVRLGELSAEVAGDGRSVETLASAEALEREAAAMCRCVRMLRAMRARRAVGERVDVMV